MLVTSHVENPLSTYKLHLVDSTGHLKTVLLLKCSGHKTLNVVGFEDMNSLLIIDSSVSARNAKPSPESIARSKSTTKSTERRNKNKAKPVGLQSDGDRSGKVHLPRIGSKKQSRCNMDYSNGDEDNDRKKHWRKHQQVHIEADNILKELRKSLNDQAIENCPPKQRLPLQYKPEPNMQAPEQYSFDTGKNLGGKAGKTFFNVLELVMKSRKHTQQALHIALICMDALKKKLLRS
jgi:hypothetical protein